MFLLTFSNIVDGYMFHYNNEKSGCFVTIFFKNLIQMVSNT